MYPWRVYSFDLTEYLTGFVGLAILVFIGAGVMAICHFVWESLPYWWYESRTGVITGGADVVLLFAVIIRMFREIMRLQSKSDLKS